MKKIILLFYLLFSFGCFCYYSQSVRAIGISVKPKTIFIQAKEGQIIEKEILVTNISQEPLIYKIYTDSYKKEITFLPDNFRLESGEHQLIKLRLNSQEIDTRKTEISILTKPLGGYDFLVSSGAMITLTYEIIADKDKAVARQEKILLSIVVLSSFLLLTTSLLIIKK